MPYLSRYSIYILFLVGSSSLVISFTLIAERQRGSWEWGNGMRGKGIQIISGYLIKLHLTAIFNFFSEQFLPLYPYRNQHAID